MNEQDLYISLTKAEKTVINHHRVWDRDRFISAQIEQYSGPKVEPEDRHIIGVASKADYIAFRQRTK